MVTVLVKWLLLVTKSTTMMIESFPLDSGSSTINSTLTASQGASGIRSRCSSPVGGQCTVLVHRHMSHVETYLPMYMYLDICGHQ